jgi:hypothetical protein
MGFKRLNCNYSIKATKSYRVRLCDLKTITVSVVMLCSYV